MVQVLLYLSHDVRLLLRETVQAEEEVCPWHGVRAPLRVPLGEVQGPLLGQRVSRPEARQESRQVNIVMLLWGELEGGKEGGVDLQLGSGEGRSRG